MSGEESWSDWAFNIVVKNGVGFGVGFLVFAVWRNYESNKSQMVTSFRPVQTSACMKKMLRDVPTCLIPKQEKLSSYLRESSFCFAVVSGTSDAEFRSNFVFSCLASFEGPIVHVDLHSLPAESLQGWIARLGEMNTVRQSWSFLSSAFQQLYALVRGYDLQTDSLQQNSNNNNNSSCENNDMSTLDALLSSLRSIEYDLRSMAKENNSSHAVVVPLVFLDGCECLHKMRHDDVGRRAIVIFVSWLWRQARRGVCRVVMTADEMFVLREVLLRNEMTQKKDKILLMQLRNEQEEGGDDGKDEICELLSKVRYDVSMKRASQMSTLWQPVGQCVEEAWTSQQMSQMCQMVMERKQISLYDAVNVLQHDFNALFSMLSCNMMSLDIETLMISFPKHADFKAVAELL